ncbi:MAG: Na/Pi cotransporter family protein, partial [Actinomycetia bacterium]|nr:Na/Pi cotransporter family protein [Actinomycetes bacterium]
GVGIIFGANIGTTTGAWLMAAFGMKVKISAYAMPMLVFGLILTFQKRQDLQGAGRVLAGLGFLFLGIHYMKEGFEAVGSSFDLSQYALTGYQGLFTYAGLGVLATVVMQSSHATLLLTIAALASGQVTYENALALAIGANIGTTITAIIGALSAKVAGKRLALAHLIFNTVTALLAIAFIGPFRWCVDQVAVLAGVAADDWTLKLAIFHTLFNLVGVAVMIPVIQPLVRFLEARVRPGAEASCLRPQHLNDTVLQHPDTALQALHQETAHLFDNAFEILAHGLNLHRRDILSRHDLDEVVAVSTAKMEVDVMDGYYGSIKVLYNAIVDFASRARTETRLSETQTTEVSNLLMVCNVASAVIDHLSS